MQFLKQKYYRSPKLLKLVTELSCQNCGATPTQAAHSNWHGGKGRGIKASDEYIAALCQTCHHDIDAGNKLTKAQRRELWERAHLRTVHILRLNDQWPIDIPVPNITIT